MLVRCALGVVAPVCVCVYAHVARAMRWQSQLWNHLGSCTQAVLDRYLARACTLALENKGEATPVVSCRGGYRTCVFRPRTLLTAALASLRGCVVATGRQPLRQGTGV